VVYGWRRNQPTRCGSPKPSQLVVMNNPARMISGLHLVRHPLIWRTTAVPLLRWMAGRAAPALVWRLPLPVRPYAAVNPDRSSSRTTPITCQAR
jgi:hypothetical protein